MCGIVYIRKERKPAKGTAWSFFEGQKERGTDGFGYIALQDGHIKNYVRRQSEKGIKKELDKETAHEILFHHRIPTSTINIEETAHPIKVSDPKLEHDYYLIHNGIITNCDDLKKDHEKRGFRYTTEVKTQYLAGDKLYTSEKEEYNDSESLAIELALYLEKQKGKMEADGQNAFICLQTDKKGKAIRLFFGRNEGNPLKMEKLDRFFALSSAGQGKLIEAHKLHAYDYATGEISIEDMPIGKYSYVDTSYKGGYNREMGFSLYDYRGKSKYEEKDIDPADRSLYNDLIMEKISIEEDIKRAKKVNNYDELISLEYELEALNEEIKVYEHFTADSV